MTPIKEISVLGCGWYGLAMAKKLVEKGYHVKGSTTSEEKIKLLQDAGITPHLLSFEEDQESFDIGFFASPLLLICIPPKRSTAQQHTFLPKIKRIADAALENGVQHMIFISSTSVYGDHNHEVNELIFPVPDTESGKAILAAENLLKTTSGFTTTIVRFGGLIGPNRDPGRFFAGKSAISNGKAPVNLIHLTDCIGITLDILEKEAYGYVYNACSPDHPSRSSFYTAAANAAGLELPVFIQELSNWKVVTSINIRKKLQYNFQVPLHPVATQ